MGDSNDMPRSPLPKESALARDKIVAVNRHRSSSALAHSGGGGSAAVGQLHPSGPSSGHGHGHGHGHHKRPSLKDEGQFVGLYDFKNSLGKGHFAVVKLAEHVFTGEKVAVKIIDKTKLDEMERKHLFEEVRCMKIMKHPHIIRLFEVVDTPTKLYIMMELGSGGDLFDHIGKTGKLEEPRARDLFRQMLSAIDYCHSLHIVHRDLKPENLLFCEGVLKITDFGFSVSYKPGQKLETMCGSMAYTAPEILLGDAYEGPSVDIWSLGVILFQMVAGTLPFNESNESETLVRIMEARYTPPDHMSPSCADLISKMLVVDAAHRATIDTVKNHPWVNEGCSEAPHSMRRVLDPSRLSKEDHELILSKLAEIDIERSLVTASLESGAYDHVVATYYLLAQQLLKKREESEKASSHASQGALAVAQRKESSSSRSSIRRNMSTGQAAAAEKKAAAGQAVGDLGSASSLAKRRATLTHERTQTAPAIPVEALAARNRERLSLLNSSSDGAMLASESDDSTATDNDSAESDVETPRRARTPDMGRANADLAHAGTGASARLAHGAPHHPHGKHGGHHGHHHHHISRALPDKLTTRSWHVDDDGEGAGGGLRAMQQRRKKSRSETAPSGLSAQLVQEDRAVRSAHASTTSVHASTTSMNETPNISTLDLADVPTDKRELSTEERVPSISKRGEGDGRSPVVAHNEPRKSVVVSVKPAHVSPATARADVPRTPKDDMGHPSIGVTPDSGGSDAARRRISASSESGGEGGSGSRPGSAGSSRPNSAGRRPSSRNRVHPAEDGEMDAIQQQQERESRPNNNAPHPPRPKSADLREAAASPVSASKPVPQQSQLLTFGPSVVRASSPSLHVFAEEEDEEDEEVPVNRKRLSLAGVPRGLADVGESDTPPPPLKNSPLQIKPVTPDGAVSNKLAPLPVIARPVSPGRSKPSTPDRLDSSIPPLSLHDASPGPADALAERVPSGHAFASPTEPTTGRRSRPGSGRRSRPTSAGTRVDVAAQKDLPPVVGGASGSERNLGNATVLPPIGGSSSLVSHSNGAAANVAIPTRLPEDYGSMSTVYVPSNNSAKMSGSLLAAINSNPAVAGQRPAVSSSKRKEDKKKTGCPVS